MSGLQSASNLKSVSELLNCRRIEEKTSRPLAILPALKPFLRERHFMRSFKLLIAVSAVALFSAATPSFAYIACSASHDCWQTETKVKWPGATIMFHEDSWRDEHKNDEKYRFHEASPERDWRRGYWADGAWHSG